MKIDDPSNNPKWQDVDWHHAEQEVAKIQHRITNAAEEGRHRDVRNLQRMLIKSLPARLIAVRKVAQDNKGKNTCGVDKQLWATPEAKLQAALNLTNTKRKPCPMKRVEIPKANGKTRPLGIPSMTDRALQALWNLALLPVAEATADKHSYGFRPYKGCHDAYAQIQILLGRAKAGGATWVLDADIKGFFDHLSHEWMLKNIPMCSKTLEGWLKAGILKNGRYENTTEGTPQGGVISPTLANMALDGLEDFLAKRFKNGRSYVTNDEGKKSSRVHRTAINVVRYADDFIVTGRSKRQLERIKEAIIEFLAIRGLELSEEKTNIRHIDEGFSFLGWDFKRYKSGVFMGTISKKSIKSHKESLKEVIKNSGNLNEYDLIKVLNPKITGWMNYHKVCSRIHQVWGKQECWLWKQLWLWARKRHRSKGALWIKQRYWTSYRNNNWTFHGSRNREGVLETVYLNNYEAKHTKRITRVPADLNVFKLENKDKLHEIVVKKRADSITGVRGKLYSLQTGKCPDCDRLINPKRMHLHHITPVACGGTNKLSNLVLLHPSCHEKRPEHAIARTR